MGYGHSQKNPTGWRALQAETSGAPGVVQVGGQGKKEDCHRRACREGRRLGSHRHSQLEHPPGILREQPIWEAGK